MKFTVYLVDKKSKMDRLKNNSVFMSKDLVSVFHFNLINTGLSHIVFNINDEYMVGTKISGNQLNYPIKQYINSFYHHKSGVFYLENVNEEYNEEILRFLDSENIALKRLEFHTNFILKFLNTFTGHIKKIEFEDKNEESFSFETISQNNLMQHLSENKKIIYISFLSGDYFISLYRSGLLSVNESDINYLIKFIEDFQYVAKNYN